MKKNTASSFGCSLLILLALSLGFGCAPKSRGLSDATAEIPDASVLRADSAPADSTKTSKGKTKRSADSDVFQSQVDRRVRDYLAANDKEGVRSRDELIRTAKKALGTPYVRGGTSTNGFDCSGFVQWTFNQVGVKLPRTAREQAQAGRAVRNPNDMEVGDIVAFHHPKRGYHTGIYVGDGKFIHSPRKRTTVRINDLDDPYFSKTFLGARRIKASSPDEIDAAQNMLAEYREKESRRSSKREADKSSTREVASKSKGKKGVQQVALRSSNGKGSTKGNDRSKDQARSRTADSRIEKKGTDKKAADTKAVSSRSAVESKSKDKNDRKASPDKAKTEKSKADKGKSDKAQADKSRTDKKDSREKQKASDSKGSAQKDKGKTTVAKVNEAKKSENTKKKGS